MKIVVCSCDKNDDLWEPFHHCIEKYWSNHPEIIYKTETKQNPYYRTLCADYPISQWTKGIREILSKIDDDKILIMMDDLFIRKQVDVKRLDYLEDKLKGNIACFNLEKSFDINDISTDVQGFKKRQHGSNFEVSIMCGLWNKDKLMIVLSEDCTPWEIESRRKNYGFDFYINSEDYIIDYGYVTWQPMGIMKGKWCKEVVSFFEKEGIDIDYTKRGFIE